MTPARSAPRVAFRELTLGYEGRPALSGLDGVIATGSLTAIIGPNGSGKSTLLKGIAGILRPLAGVIERFPSGGALAYLPQQSEIDRSFPACVADLVALGLWRRRGMLGRHDADDRAAIGRALDLVGLHGAERRGVDTLSGGQLQRVLFARVLLQDADLILLDEPFSAVDALTVDALLAFIGGWHAEGRTVLTVLHDLDLVREHFPRALLLARRPVAWGETGDVLRGDHLAEARRLNVWDAPAAAGRERIAA